MTAFDPGQARQDVLIRQLQGMGGRLLGATALSPYSLGPNAQQVTGSLATVHTGRAVLVIAFHSGRVSGATPYGFLHRILLDGALFATSGASSSALDETFPLSIVGPGSELSGPHTWTHRAEAGNNPNVFESPGTGFMAVFEL